MNDFKQILTTKQTQSMVLKPKMLQSLKMLTMPLMELETQLKIEMIQNPMLEVVDFENDQLDENEIKSNETVEKSEEKNEVDEELKKTLEEAEQLSEILDSYNELYRENVGKQPKQERFEMEDYIPSKKNSKQEFLNQLDDLDLSEDEYDFAYDLIESCNVYGFLEKDFIFYDAALEYEISEARADAIHEQILHFEPAGITATTIEECLLAQVVQTPRNDLLLKLIAEDFDDLIHKRYKKIAKKHSTTENNILFWKEQISHLDPKPGLRVIDNNDKFIVPDVIIKKIDNKYEIIVNDFSFPRIRISRSYKKILEKVRNEKESLAYVREKVNSARFLIKSIYLRSRTLERVTESIIRNQSDFFYNKNGVLKPLTYSVIAEELQVNESTISRVVRRKYADTPFGIMCLKDFFTSKAGKNESFEAVSRQSVEQKIIAMIEREDKSCPLSDNDIADEMKKTGIVVSRRVVAKYRKAKGILNSHLRRS